jgi:sterol desaturase/sphingolipid hydroxylase (fatty acid hydroxylase superfamily)
MSIEKTQQYRRDYRATEIGRLYSGWLHLGFTSTATLAMIAVALYSLMAPSLLELVVVPVTFLYANLIEYLLHRFPMHHRIKALGILHTRRTLQHHRFFTDEMMDYESSRDIKMVLFPPVMVVAFVLSALPVMVALRLLVSSNVGWLFLATAVAYFLSYEWLHFAYHLPGGSIIWKLPGLGVLQRHHAIHHAVRLMGACNFNVTFPICDVLFGTFRRAGTVKKSSVPENFGPDFFQFEAAERAEQPLIHAPGDGLEFEDLQRRGHRSPWAVGPVFADGLVPIGERDDARQQRDLGLGEAIGIAGTVK